MSLHLWCQIAILIAAGGISALRPTSLRAIASPRPHQHENDNKSENIIVIGAGLAGLSVSLGLAQLGYHVDLVEKRTNFKSKGAAFRMCPNGEKAVRELSPEAADSLVEKGIDVPGGGYNLPWWCVRDALLEQVLRRSDKITLRMGLAWTEIDDVNDPTQVQARFVGSGQAITLHGRLLIGADGVHSSVREKLGCPPSVSGGSYIWRSAVDVLTQEGSSAKKLAPLLDKGVNPMGWPTFGPTSFSAYNFHPTMPGMIGWTVTTKHPNVKPGDHPWSVFEPYAVSKEDEDIIKAFFDLSPEEDVRFVSESKVVKPPSEPGQGWGGKGRVTLIGDAAHALRAASGLGGAMAFEDGAVLCRILSDACGTNLLLDRSCTEEIISQFENSRIPRVYIVWEDEWDRAEKFYTEKRAEPWTAEYKEWLFQGV